MTKQPYTPKCEEPENRLLNADGTLNTPYLWGLCVDSVTTTAMPCRGRLNLI